MSKDKPIIFWSAFGVLSVIAIALLGWGASGIWQFSTVAANQTALTDRVTKIESKQATIDTMATDIAVIKTKLESIEQKVGHR